MAEARGRAGCAGETAGRPTGVLREVPSRPDARAGRRAEPAVEVPGPAPDRLPVGATGGPATRTVLGHPAAERELRLALEHSYRMLARLSDRAETRIEWVERADRARPRTWV
ncbi:tetratricopeptide repeat protein [Kitasatospora sp. NA04385]|uniref:tetratricopeptide repeat protein n=1 Tax=Kitasatospora sp. NA04385 TaxID=2742135 RepID=UPI0020CABCC8|nr:tetratricopeptide repeat protein [Kitasatospora sp. NA04385]